MSLLPFLFLGGVFVNLVSGVSQNLNEWKLRDIKPELYRDMQLVVRYEDCDLYVIGRMEKALKTNHSIFKAKIDDQYIVDKTAWKMCLAWRYIG